MDQQKEEFGELSHIFFL